MPKLIAKDDIGKKVFLRSLANAPELVTDRLEPDNWETNVLCRVDGSGGKYLVSVCFAKGKIEYDVSCRSADPFKDVSQRRPIGPYGKDGFPDLEAALAYSNGEGESPLALETWPATAEEIAAIPCLSPSRNSQPCEIDPPGPGEPPPAEVLGLPPSEEVRGVADPVADAYRKFVASLAYIGTEKEAILCDSNPFYVTRWDMPKDENLCLLEILFGSAPGVLAGFREEIIEEEKEDIEPVPEDAGEEWCREVGDMYYGQPEPLRLYLQWRRMAKKAAGIVSTLSFPKVGREIFRFRVEPECFSPCSPDAYHYRAWEFGEGWVAVAKVGVRDDDYVAHLVPLPLGFVRADRFLKGLCRLFNENGYAWSGATPFLGWFQAVEGPWGKIGRTELALAVASGYADFFGRGPWHKGEICRWSEARLRRVAGELSRAGLDPLDLVHRAYIGDR